jgi:hypothetical protein
VSHTVDPISLIFNSFLLVDVIALTMSQPILDISHIGRAIWPCVATDTCDLIAVELAFVHGLIRPVELPLAMKKAVFELTLVRMSISELACTLTVIDFTNLHKIIKR